MKKDSYDLSVSTNDVRAMDALNHFHQQLLNSGKEADKILEAAEAYPGVLIIQCYAASLLLYAQDSTLDAKALIYLNTAETLLRQITEREHLIFKAIKAWHQLDYELALTLLTRITTQWPRDCTSAKMVEWLYYCSGQPYHAKPFLAMCENMHAHCKQHAGFLAIHSFALELNGHYQAAMELALNAIELNSSSPWAHHTIGHVTLNTSKINEGSQLFHRYAPTWETISPFLRGHLYWHYALYAIANRDEAAANNHYQNGIWGANRDATLEQLDAISYLWRMQMAGMPQDEKLLIVVKHSGEHPFKFYMPFINAHYIYALARTNQHAQVKYLLNLTQNYATTLTGKQQQLWKNITLPLLCASAAFAEENYQLAADYFAPIISSITQGGGSDAQNELFYQAYLVSLIKSGQLKTAQPIFDEKLAHYKPTALGEYWSLHESFCHK